MEYIIGAYSMDVQIAPLIKNRIESGHITGISVKGDGKYAEVTVGSRDKILLLAGLPLLVHIIMDLSDYEGFFLFLPELSVLLLMASLLCLALRLRPAGRREKT